MSASDKVSTTVLPTRGLSSATWDEIWSLTAEFYDVERAFIEGELRSRRAHRAVSHERRAARHGLDPYPCRRNSAAAISP